MKNFLFALSGFLFSALLFSQTSVETKKIPSVITKHKISFQDNYSWLEDMRSTEVGNWVDKENQVTNSHLEEIKKTQNITSTIKEYDAKTTYLLPNKKGKYFYAYFTKDKKQASSLYMMKNLDDAPIEIVNPNKIYTENKVSFAGYFPSKNSSLLAYKISVDGSDKQEIRFVDLDKNHGLEDVLKDIKFSKVAWNKDRGVFYKKNSNKDFFAKDSTFQLFYHRIGTKQEEDELIFDASKNEGNIEFSSSRSKLFVTETNKEETSKNYYYADLENGDFQLHKFIENDTTGFKFINYRNGRVYFSSDKFNWGDVRSFDIKNKTDETTVIPQIYMHLLSQTYFSDDYIICKYKTVGKNYIIFYDYSGKLIRRIDAPNGMAIEFLNFDQETKDFYYAIYSYTSPFKNFKINIETGYDQPFFSRTNRAKPTLFPLDYFETKTITYKSRDNVDVPITIVHKKGIPLDGNNPTLLEAYGGFGIVSAPFYDTGLIYFLEKGGVYAYAEIRGGGEKGKKWHKEGMGLKKINTSNDFIDAAKFLIKEKYTSSSKLAISGASQGGLLVGVAMTQRPDLFKVAIPKVGAFDMAKFDQYTTGRFHLDEYGNPEKENEYKNLLAYSPYHNIKEDVNYPTTLIITSENDNRVPPLHSYKFAARLQNRITQKNPIYLQTIKKAGHHGGSSPDDQIDQKATFYEFLLYHLSQ